MLADTVVDQFLQDGSWTEAGREDLSLRERLSSGLVRTLVDDFRRAPKDRGAIRQLGLLTLGPGVAHWGVSDTSNLPDDPQGDAWRGPTRGRGKHLMSHSIGGIGIAHLDTGWLGDYIAFARAAFPDLSDSRADRTVDDFGRALRDGKATYDKARNRRGDGGEGAQAWGLFSQWVQSSLRQRACQRWILEQWLERYWLPSFDAVSAEGGSVQEASVNARIRNSGSVFAKAALTAARGSSDRIQAQLDAYVRVKSRHQSRLGYMRRPVAILDAWL